MGYAFTFPFVRLIAGSEISIGAYVHYPTVSTDMVKRVRDRSAGVESAGKSSSWFRTQIKLVYYRIFTGLYATSLLFAEHIMTNSSWTQAHIKSLLTAGRSSLLASILLLDEQSISRNEAKGGSKAGRQAECIVVFPPCDTAGLVELGNLASRKREIVSLAQFRWALEAFPSGANRIDRRKSMRNSSMRLLSSLMLIPNIDPAHRESPSL